MVSFFFKEDIDQWFPNLAIPQNPLENLLQLMLSHPTPVSDLPALHGALEFALEKPSSKRPSFVLECRTGRACEGTAVNRGRITSAERILSGCKDDVMSRRVVLGVQCISVLRF